MQGDVIGVYSKTGAKLASYVYDAWGNFTVTYSNGGASIPAVVKNPFRYRGYYYDVDLGLYYLQSRYYDANTGRFISPDDVTYLGANGDLNSYNLYAYCSNNPVMYADPSGHAIISALIIGALAGALIGGTVGGIVSYNSAKAEGLSGWDLVQETLSGIGRGLIVGGLAGTLAGATVGAIAFGAGTVVGTALITGSATIAARVTEVAILQYRVGVSDGDGGWQIANNIFSSVCNNLGAIISPAITKTATTSISYMMHYKNNPISLQGFAQTTTNGLIAYSFAAYAWYQTFGSLTALNPRQRANSRGYSII